MFDFVADDAFGTDRRTYATIIALSACLVALLVVVGWMLITRRLEQLRPNLQSIVLHEDKLVLAGNAQPTHDVRIRNENTTLAIVTVATDGTWQAELDAHQLGPTVQFELINSDGIPIGSHHPLTFQLSDSYQSTLAEINSRADAVAMLRTQTAPDILYLQSPDETAAPGGTLQLVWDTLGNDAWYLEARTNTSDEPIWSRQLVVPRSTVVLDIPNDARGTLIVRLSNSAETVERALTYALPCEHNWIVEDQQTGCPAAAATVSATQQAFEQGFMLDTGEAQGVLIVDAQLLNHWQIAPMAVPAQERATGLRKPPLNRVLPEGNFGRIWQNDDEIRSTLGWATAAPLFFETTIQCHQDDPTQCYVKLAEGGTLAITATSWSILR